ncbi:MAG: hypothetical protein V7686_02705 [Qipengyuania sp.]
MIVEALLANAAILLGMAIILWVVAVQIDDVSLSMHIGAAVWP